MKRECQHCDLHIWQYHAFQLADFVANKMQSLDTSKLGMGGNIIMEDYSRNLALARRIDRMDKQTDELKQKEKG